MKHLIDALNKLNEKYKKQLENTGIKTGWHYHLFSEVFTTQEDINIALIDENRTTLNKYFVSSCHLMSGQGIFNFQMAMRIIEQEPIVINIKKTATAAEVYKAFKPAIDQMINELKPKKTKGNEIFCPPRYSKEKLLEELNKAVKG